MTREKLLTIYDLFTTWAEQFNFSCKKGCSTCCTSSVSMTTLEGELIVDYIRSEKQELLDLLDAIPKSSLKPKTTNQFAADCINHRYEEDDPGSWDMAPCVFLENNCCTIYPVRPFMCRSLGSRVTCDETGSAEMDPLFLTLNTIILQCIEHIDQGRPWGNMYTILSMVKVKENNFAEHTARHDSFSIAEPIPGFLIPPDEVARLQVQLRMLQNIIREE